MSFDSCRGNQSVMYLYSFFLNKTNIAEKMKNALKKKTLEFTFLYMKTLHHKSVDWML